MNKIYKLTLLLAILFSGPLRAESLQEILALPDAPTGVVIDIIESDASDLQRLIPQIQDATRQLRQRFKDLPVAVVSHGREQFALTSKNITKHAGLEDGVKNLVNSDVDVHVCGTHASWYDVTPEDFPDYIDVAAVGPAQVNDYINLGYVLLDL